MHDPYAGETNEQRPRVDNPTDPGQPLPLCGQVSAADHTRPAYYSRHEALRRGLALLGTGVLAPSLFAYGPRVGAARGAEAHLTSRAAAADLGHIARSSRDLGFGLYSQITGGTPAGNVVFSPLSIGTALAMVYNGARGSTAHGMATTLGVSGLSLDAVDGGYAALQQMLRTVDPGVDLAIANSIWAQRGIPFDAAFLRRVNASYQARVTTLDFRDPSAGPTIDAWVTRQTHGLIDHIAPKRFPKDEIMYLVNAVSFKGTWTVPFDRAKTVDKPFTHGNGSTGTVPMMTREGSIAYARGAGYQAAMLPYGNGRLGLYLFLPDVGSSLAALQPILTPAAWEHAVAALNPAYGTINLPRFSASYAALPNLNMPLAALGMGEAFTRQADFSGLTTASHARISEVAHHAVLHVDERGTTAAAATGIQAVATAVRAPSFTLTLDRPFFCAIREETSGAVLFMGAIVDPRP